MPIGYLVAMFATNRSELAKFASYYDMMIMQKIVVPDGI
jgi:hypothetical protein